MTVPAASVLVRAKDKAGTIGRTLSALRSQTVPAEIVVIDSGSTDGTLEIARGVADRVLELPPDAYTPGRALNLGAREAAGAVHFALSAHCFPERTDWIERSLRHYERSDVAATNGALRLPDGRPLLEVFVQDLAHARSDLTWGFSNHASSWRATVWERFPFDETLEASEDKEWALRVLAEGWRIVIDPVLWVSAAHAMEHGAVALFRRARQHARAIATFAPREPPTFRDALAEWWSNLPANEYPPSLNRLNYYRLARILGTYAGTRSAGRRPR